MNPAPPLLPPPEPAAARAGAAVRIALLLAALAVFAYFYVRLASYLTDDVFISARYAANLAAGKGLVYNAGERVEGYTNFLWTLLLAPPLVLRLDLIAWIKWMNALWAVLAAFLAMRVARSFARAAARPVAARGATLEGAAPPEPWWTVVPGVLTLAASPFVLSAAEGLETMMFAALLALLVLWTWEARPGERWPRAAFALAALGMTRPDGWAYLAWGILAGALRGLGRGWLLRFSLVAIGLLAVHEVGRLLYYGDLLPNTLYAKSGGTGFLLDRGWTQLLDFLAATGGFLWLLALVPLAWRESRPGAIALLAAIAVRVAFHVWSGGPWMARGRFLAPVWPLAVVLFAWGTALLLRRGPALALGLAVVAALALVPGWRRHAALEAVSLQYGRSLRAAHQRLGADVARHTEAGAVMAMDDAGVGPLVAGRTNIDMLGLNDRHLGKLRGDFGVKFDAQYVLDRNPDVVVLMSRRPPPITPADLFVTGQIALFEDPLFQQRYAFAREYVFSESYRLLLWRRVDSHLVHEALWSAPAAAAPVTR